MAPQPPDTRDTLVVNVFGGPGVGKSTFAATLFAALKRHHVCVELVTEVPKDRIWEGRPHAIHNKVTILGDQWGRIEIRLGKVDVVVCDGPVLLASVYASPDDPPCFHELVRWCHARPRRLDLRLERPPVAYDTYGRLESWEEAQAADQRVQALLAEVSGDAVWTVTDRDGDLPRIVEAVLARLPAPA
ncbi:AAA family ATPase [Roseospira marina]|uniref:AAA family ATPase n=1 Tax=Roseospira marina TaxID=140057 RepID=A0A5M6I9T5_9PROT|nr:AAA family ATPase [Roseospira marina]KAA5605000.1 AAA family ATPase [Roseospira marina]MBB4314993.1 hypothetical protein [Roseospira marina]MBB5087993.1 hypothetical protein [Roseospira marina]